MQKGSSTAQRSVFISGLPYTAQESDIKAFFEGVGEIE